MGAAPIVEQEPGPGEPGIATARLRRLTVRDFRNLPGVTLPVPAEGVALVGDNGHGKTNLLEAVHYLHLFRSLRGARDQELVRFGAAAFHVSATADGTRCATVAVGFERDPGRRRILLDGVPCDRLTDALGALPSVVFAPADAALVAGAPAGRRHFLDVVLASASRRYLAALREYRTALAQRNAALRAGSGRRQAAVWEVPLARQGARLRLERAAFVAWARPRIAGAAAALGEPAALDLRYRSTVVLPDDTDEDRACDALALALAGSRDRDHDRAMTHAGPHRDDLDLRLGAVSMRRYGSAGQHRTAAIALRLVECAWYRERTGVEPVLLLDDPLAELDRHRAASVLALLAERPDRQVVLAVPREDDIPAALTALPRCLVRDGTVTPFESRHA